MKVKKNLRLEWNLKKFDYRMRHNVCFPTVAGLSMDNNFFFAACHWIGQVLVTWYSANQTLVFLSSLKWKNFLFILY